MGAGAAQGCVEVVGRQHCSVDGGGFGPALRRTVVDRLDLRDCMPVPPAGSRSGVDLDAAGAVAVVGQLCRQAGVAVQGQHLLDLEAVDLDVAGRQSQCLATGGERDLGEARPWQDWEAVHLVVGQPRVQFGADVGLPGVAPARR